MATVLAIVLASLAVTAAGQGSFAGARTVGASALDACELVTLEEFEQAFGIDLDAATGKPTDAFGRAVGRLADGCYYGPVSSGLPAAVSITATRTASKAGLKTQKDLEKKLAVLDRRIASRVKPLTLPQGGRAFFGFVDERDRNAAILLVVDRDKSVVVTINAFDLKRKAARRAATAIASTVLGKIPG